LTQGPDDHFARHWIREPEPAAKTLYILADADHLRVCFDEFREARPFVDEAKGVLADSDQNIAASVATRQSLSAHASIAALGQRSSRRTR